MENNDSMKFRLGDLDVTVKMNDGEVVGITATDENGYTWDVGFALERLPGDGGGCQICRYIGGHKVCWDVDCQILERPASADTAY